MMISGAVMNVSQPICPFYGQREVVLLPVFENFAFLPEELSLLGYLSDCLGADKAIAKLSIQTPGLQ